MKPDEMDAVFAALALEGRRRILDILKKEPGCNVKIRRPDVFPM